MMRWGYLIPRVIIIALVWSFLAFFFDPLLRRAMITAGCRTAGAPVEISDVKTILTPPSFEVKDVSIADRFSPETNLLEFDRMSVRVSGWPMLHKRFVVEDASITGLQWGTPRNKQSDEHDHDATIDPAGEKGDGASHGSGRLDAVSDKVSGLGKKLLNGLLDRVKDQLDPRQLETVVLTRQLHEKWGTRFELLESRTEGLKTRLAMIQETVKNAKGHVLERVEAYAQAAEQVNLLLDEVDSIRGEFPKLVKDAEGDFGSLNTTRQRDFQQVQRKLRLEHVDGEDLTQLLLGDEMSSRLDEAVEWMSWTKRIVEEAQVEYQPQRSRGIDINFSRDETGPNLLFRRLTISGQADFGDERFAFKGIVRGLTTEPAAYGRPTMITIAARGDAQVSLEAALDYTRDVPVNDVVISYWLPESDKSTPNELGFRCDAKLRLSGEDLSGQLAIRQEPLVIPVDSLADLDEQLQVGLRSVVGEIHHLDATIALSGTLAKPQWKLESNIGPELAAGMNRFLANEIESHKQQLIAQVDEIVQERTLGFEQMLNERYASVIEKLNVNDKQIRLLAQKVAGRPLNLNGLIRR